QRQPIHSPLSVNAYNAIPGSADPQAAVMVEEHSCNVPGMCRTRCRIWLNPASDKSPYSGVTAEQELPSVILSEACDPIGIFREREEFCRSGRPSSQTVRQTEPERSLTVLVQGS